MRFREFHYRWEWVLRASPKALWPLIADTNRFNREAGVPPVEPVPEDGGPSRNARRHLRLFRLGLPVEWEEDPFEWVWPHRFGVVRRYARGPVAEMRVLAQLTAPGSSGSRFVYEVWTRPRNILGLLAIPVEIGLRAARRFNRTIRRYDELAAAGALPQDQPGPVSLAPGGHDRLVAARASLEKAGGSPELVARLLETIERADDLTLTRLRPYALADHWEAPRRAVLELCLLATRGGLLDFRWDLLCPLCRGAKASVPSLSEVQAETHCDSCHIGFTIDFDRSVELTFRPNPAIRRVDDREFCIGGPQVTPHVVVQQLLPPGSAREVTVSLPEGRYRLRALELPGGRLIGVTGSGVAAASFRAGPTGWEGDPLEVAPRATVSLENATASEQLFILEHLTWTDQAVTAAEVTVLQLFRDLFSREALRPQERIAVGSVTLLFTDLLGSTQLYREIGDAPAFGRVMSHFDVLRDAVASEGGAIVKTMGDAVMAAFWRPAAALRAILSAQQRLAAPPEGVLPLSLKGGVHCGPCIAVTLNDRLDYFGSIVNVAARLEGLSSGRDVIISAPVRVDPEVAALLDRSDGGVAAERFEATLKGFDTERFELWRVRRPSGPA